MLFLNNIFYFIGDLGPSLLNVLLTQSLAIPMKISLGGMERLANHHNHRVVGN
jgi:hypothetical protein